MPDEPLTPPRQGGKVARPLAEEKFRDFAEIGDVFTPLAEVLPANLRPGLGRPHDPRKMYHPAGRFLEQNGARFDYLFPDLLDDPAWGLPVFLGVPTLLRGTGDLFVSRRSAREEDRLSIGLKYGHGDLPAPPGAA